MNTGNIRTTCGFFVILFSFLLGIVMVSGCGGRARPKGFPKLYKCIVTVTHEGAPLAEAIVSLHSKDDPIDWTVRGQTDDSGKAIIFTHGYYPGAPKGKFAVTVKKTEIVVPPMPEKMPKNEDARLKIEDRIEADTREYDLVNTQFNSPETTPLELVVEGKCSETFDVGALTPIPKS